MSNSPGITRLAGPAPAQHDESAQVPQEALGRLFLRFLKFGALAWGAPVAQIAMRSARSSSLSIPTVIVFAVALAVLFDFTSEMTIPTVVAGAAAAGYVLSMVSM